MAYRAVILGGSGLIGGNLITRLLQTDQVISVLSISRADLGLSHDKLTQILIDFKDLDKYSREIKGDVIYSCLGTTRRETPDQEVYKNIDFNYPLIAARAGEVNKVPQFHLISSIGADISSMSSYLQLKGELEDEMKKFNYKSIHICRPSFIAGKRKKTRSSDKIFNPLMRLLNPLLMGRLKQYRSIEASVIANAMLNQTMKDLSGTFIYPSTEIQKLA